MNNQASADPIDDYILLKGRPPLAKFIRFIRENCVAGSWTNDGDLAEEWRAAREIVLQIQKDEANTAEDVNVRALPDEMGAIAEIGMRSPSVKRLKQYSPRKWQLVEIDKLVVFQQTINLRYVEEIKSTLSLSPSAEEVIRTAVGNVAQRRPAVRSLKVSDTSFVYSSASNDLRYLDIVNLDADSISGAYSPSGCATHALVIFLGFTDNLISAVRAKDRIFLTNGSHRAFALRDLGLKYVPCLMAEAAREEEFDLVLPGDVKEDRDQYLRNPRPSLFKDYFDERVRKIVKVVRKNRLLQATLNLEKISVPAV